MVELTINKNEAGQRFDKYLLKYLNNAPKSFVYKMLRKKNIILNGKKADGSEKLQSGDSVKLFLADETLEKFKGNTGFSTQFHKTPSINVSDIIYEDEDILLINKKAGILSQKAAPSDISINEMLISYLISADKLKPEALSTFKPSVCNRLDRNTTGLIAAGKSLTGLQVLSSHFKERTVDKYYITIVNGTLLNEEKITGYLKKDEKNNKVFISPVEADDSEYIETGYIPLHQFDYKEIPLTLLKVKLITGKPHQIRAHLSSLDHAIIGDTKYGNNVINSVFQRDFNVKHQLLHSYSLTFPKNETKLINIAGKTFTAKPPKIYEDIVGGKIYGYLEFERS